MLTPQEELRYGHAVSRTRELISCLDASGISVTFTELVKRSKSDSNAWAELLSRSAGSINAVVNDGFRARQQLISANVRLVLAIAKRYQGNGLDIDDLTSEGMVGLMRAAEQFDPDKAAFSTYAVGWIRCKMADAVRTKSRTIRLPNNRAKDLNRFRRQLSELQQSLGRSPTDREIEQHLGIDRKTLDNYRFDIAPVNSIHLYQDWNMPTMEAIATVDDAWGYAESQENMQTVEHLFSIVGPSLGITEQELAVTRMHVVDGMSCAAIARKVVTVNGRAVSRRKIKTIIDRTLKALRYVAENSRPSHFS